MPFGWKIEYNQNTPMIRKWTLVTPHGKSSRWKTKAYAVAHAETCFVDEQIRRVRRTLNSLMRKYGIRFNETASMTSESYYFFATYPRKGTKVKIRISSHPTVDDTQDFDIIARPVDGGALRSFLKRTLLQKSINVA